LQAITSKRKTGKGNKMENGSQLSVTQAVSGSLALYRVNGMSFPVRVLDARRVYGRTDALIEPVGGEGQKWVQSDQITMKGGE
jgi:hypothetical protein